MSRRARRLTSLLLGVALLTGLPAGCSSGSDPAQPNASAAAVCPDTPAGPQASSATDTAEVVYQPLKRAVVGETPPAGVYHTFDGTPKGKPVQILHTPVVCGQPFTERLDFTRLGPLDTCVDNSSNESVNRPCHQKFRPQPDNRAKSLEGSWEPVEGDQLNVVCQVVANQVPLQGIQQDNGPAITPPQPQRVLNVWNKVPDSRITPLGYGFINDVWTGGAGFRGPRCPSADLYHP